MIDNALLVFLLRAPERLRDRPGRRQQCLDEAAGLFSVQLDGLPLANEPLGSFQRVSDDECGDGAAFDGRSTLEQLLVRLADSRHEPLTLSFLRDSDHEPNVCLSGTHCKR